MLEPQSPLFFLLLVTAFGVLVWLLVVAKRVALRIVAGCLAFIPAMMFGVAAVNKYYDYYQSWGAAIGDLTNQGPPAVQANSLGSHILTATGMSVGGRASGSTMAETDGLTVKLSVPDRAIGITRTVYVYLPPQYFQPTYHTYRFPAIELIHGSPGAPQDWITVLGVNAILREMIRQQQARPVVLVMPDANGSRQNSLQCLNQVHGPQDAAYLAEFLPGFLAGSLRIQPSGTAWGIAGYSEGGFCAANLGLQYRNRYGFAGVLSGYFSPLANQYGHAHVDPFGGNERLRQINTPLDLIQTLPRSDRVPQFWTGAGTANPTDVSNAEAFQQLAQIRQSRPPVSLRLVPGGGHTMATWRTLTRPMLAWMTPRLAAEAASTDRVAAALRRTALPPLARDVQNLASWTGAVASREP